MLANEKLRLKTYLSINNMFRTIKLAGLVLLLAIPAHVSLAQTPKVRVVGQMAPGTMPGVPSAAVSYSGSVADAQGNGVPAAVIAVNMGSKAVCGALCDKKKGGYSLSVSSGPHVVSIWAPGYEKSERLIMFAESTIDAPVTLSAAASSAVGKPAIKFTGNGYKIGAKSLNAGGTLAELLSPLPGIDVKEERVSVFVVPDVTLLLDGTAVDKSGAELAEYLRSEPSQAVKQVEVKLFAPAAGERSPGRAEISITRK